MKLSILRAVKLYQAIDQLAAKPDLDKRLVYAMMRTKAKLKGAFDAVVEMEKPSAEITAFRTAHQTLLLKYTEKDADGKPKFNGPNPAITNIPELEKEFVLLKETYKSALEAAEAASKVTAEHLKTEEDFSIHMAPFAWLPEKMDYAIMESLDPMITPPEEKAPDAPKPV